MAKLLGDRTAATLGRLSLNPLRHVDLMGTLAVPCVLLAMGAPVVGWAKSVPVATGALSSPRTVLCCVVLAGPLANLAMAAAWCGVWVAVAHATGEQTLIWWIAYMAQAGIVVNGVLAVFNLLPIPPLDGGRLIAGLLPARAAARFERIEPLGLAIALGLTVLRLLDWLFEPALRVIGRVITVLVGSVA